MEIRLDPITNQAVLLATERAKRPHFGKSRLGIKPSLDAHRLKDGGSHVNPFAPGNEDMTGPEVYSVSDNPDHQPNQPDWKVRVIPNKYPISKHHEVIIHSPSATADFDRMSLRQVERVVETYMKRFKYLSDKGQVFLFCNHGSEAGASIAHPHSQIMALPKIPAAMEEKIKSVTSYYDREGQCKYCQLIEAEQLNGRRLVFENEFFMVVCPEASGWPYQLQLLPKIHQAQLVSANKPDQIKAMAESLQVMVSLYNSVLDRPAYNWWVHSVKGYFFHWHLDMVPRLKVLAGVELGAGLMVNDRISPEAAAKVFRQSLKGD